MPNPPISDEALQEHVRLVKKYPSLRSASKATGIPRTTLMSRNDQVNVRWPGLLKQHTKPFEAEELPSKRLPVDELLERRIREWDQKHKAIEARKLITVRINIPGPIGISHFGDPHVDDDGTNLKLLRHHTDIVRNTEGLFAANVGDTTNNWPGRLARLYSEQGTTASDAWDLAEWFLHRVQWLYIVRGNHDLWSGAGDPLNWITRGYAAVDEPNGARLSLAFPNGRHVRVNARHDFAGHSMWNTAHGPSKAAQMGWRDHILTCGHKHTSGYQVVKDPATGLLSHCIRVASYKTYDRYADEKGLPDQNFTENVLTVINPDAQDERRLVTVFLDVEEGAEYLTWMRQRYSK